MTKFYMVGNTHFDPVWEWKWDEAMASIRATFRSALDRMKEYPDFKYSFSSPPVFDWIKKTDPEMFEEIKQRVKEGRWDLCEGWFNQPDCFSASGESYVRQGLYGQRYLLENFGVSSECAFNTDSFGHPHMLPQILAKSGIKHYCMCRPEEHHYKLKSPLFKWKSPDGSAVNAFRIGGVAGEGWAKDTKAVLGYADKSKCDLLVVYGVTDHGGAPTKKSIEEIIACDEAEFAGVAEYFEKQENIEYEKEDEFITGDYGVYCNVPEIKRLNRKAEYALSNAEKATVISGDDNTEKLSACRKDVLFNQFHDILGGASIKSAYFDARNLYGRAIQTADEILHYSLQKVTAKIKTPGKNPDNIWNLAVWNLNCSEYDGYVEAEVQWAHEFDWYDKGITLEDENGEQIKTQIIKEYSAIPRFRSRFVFKAKIPPMGYRTFKLIRDGSEVSLKNKPGVFEIETDGFVYKISERNGSVESVYDKKLNKIIAENLFVPACYADDGDTWCFNVKGYGDKKGEFSLVKSEITESGELIEKLKLTLKYGNSLLYTYYTFYKKEDYFDAEYIVNNNEAHTVFKFDCGTKAEKLTVSAPFGSIEREMCDWDKPMGEFIEADGILYACDGNFAYNFTDGRLGITVLRSPIYGDFRLGELENLDYMISAQGINEGKIRVMHGNKRKNPASAAEMFNNPPTVVCESNHDGELPAENEYLSLKAENAIVSAVKHCEDGDGIIVRIVDYGGKTAPAELTVFGKGYAFTLNAYEIKTLKISDGKICEVDMIEREQ